MNFPSMVRGGFLKRQNRFTADVMIKNRISKAYLPTTGRLTGVLESGCKVWLEPAKKTHRKTAYTLLLTELKNGGLCAIKAINANLLFREMINAHRLKAFDYPDVQSEVTFGHSRIDFLLTNGSKSCWGEVKSVTHVADGVGLFPDAPSKRATKHLNELIKLSEQGVRTSVVFITQRQDARSFSPLTAIDGDFSETLKEAHARGVETHAFRCHVTLNQIEIAEAIPVNL
jgi:sugar fermentation stimulation protein A